MGILLKSEHETGGVGFAAERIAGVHVEARHYDIKGGQVLIEHELPDVVQYDAERLLAMGYQLAKPSEQNDLVKNKAKESTITEKQKSSGG